MYNPRLGALEKEIDMISSFKGYENKTVIGENSFSYTENMSGDCYPVISPRSKRLYFDIINGRDLHGIFAKERMVYINNGYLYYGGKKVDNITFPTITGERKFVSLGSKLIIFPDKMYVNTNDFEDFGSLEARFSTSDGITVKMCKADGTDFGNYKVSSTMPATKKNGFIWYDNSGDVHCLKQYSESVGAWIDVSETYIKIECEGIGKPFNQYDSLYFMGLRDIGISGYHVVRDKGDDYIIISGIIEKEKTIRTPVTILRSVPDMDFLCESGNRIWGCSSKHNEIYASKLGDPTNFQVYMGLSTDSYSASVGTDGDFTAAVCFRGYILFFKENCVHKIYGQNPPYTITTSYLRGVQKRSHRSVVCLNETLYYKSPTGVCAYDGNIPVSVSGDLGNELYSKAVAGALGNKYYICMTDKQSERQLFVYDEDKSFWHREGNIDICEFAQHNCNLYFIENNNGKKQLGLINGENKYGSLTCDFFTRHQEDDFEWCVESGLWGLALPENKYYSDIILRAVGKKGARLKVYFETDSSGVWVKQTDVKLEKTGSVVLPCITPRCDHLRIKIEGKGDIKIYSISRKTERGSELNV